MRAPASWARFAVRALLGTVGVLGVAGLWEGYKAVGPDAGVVVHGAVILPRTTDMAMPHVWDMLDKFSQPVNLFSGPETVGSAVFSACLFSLRLAAAG